MSIELRIKAASTLLLQAPPGEIDDCFNDVRAIVSNDKELEIGILPALIQYNLEQFVQVEFQGNKVLVNADGKVEGQDARFIDPKSGYSFEFDHIRVTASDPKKLVTDSETESLRFGLQSALSTYSDAFYNEGVSAVYALSDENFTIAIPDVEVEEKLVSEVVPGVDLSVEEVIEGEEIEGAKESKVQDEVEVEEKVEILEPVELSEIATSSEQPLKSRIFAVYLVGSKNNLTNYWTGKWRSRYVVDLRNSTIEGTVKIDVHYYELGNVQLSTTLTSSEKVPDSQSPASIISVIKKSESNFSNQISESYSELSDDTFKNLRRTLPKTRSKLDWNKISNYKIGSELSSTTAV